MNLSELFQIINYLLFHLYFPILWLFYFYRWLHKKSLDKIFKVSWISYISIVVIMAGWGALLLYQSWSNSPIYSYLLPPESNYFYLVAFRTLLYHIISVALGVVLYYLLRSVVKLTKVKFIQHHKTASISSWIKSKKTQNETVQLSQPDDRGAGFIELFEIKLLALGVILAGWSNIIMYLGLVLILMLFSSVFINLFKAGRSQRISLAPYVFLSLIITLLIGYKFSAYLGLY